MHSKTRRDYYSGPQISSAYSSSRTIFRSSRDTLPKSLSYASSFTRTSPKLDCQINPNYHFKFFKEFRWSSTCSLTFINLQHLLECFCSIPSIVSSFNVNGIPIMCLTFSSVELQTPLKKLRAVLPSEKGSASAVCTREPAENCINRQTRSSHSFSRISDRRPGPKIRNPVGVRI